MEDVKHALYSYPKLAELWKKKPQWTHVNVSSAGNFVDLIGNVFVENREPALFAIVVWALWTRRNNLRTGKKVDLLFHLLQRARERVEVFSWHNIVPEAPVGRQPARWQPLGPGLYKVNVDGALYNADNTAGLGVVIRNEQGQVMGSRSERLPLPSLVIEVEALAAQRGLELAVEIGFKNIVLESDSRILITTL